MDIIDKGQLMTLNVENCHLQPLIAKALEVNADKAIPWFWADGSINYWMFFFHG